MKREYFLIIITVVILLCLYRLSNRENFTGGGWRPWWTVAEKVWVTGPGNGNGGDEEVVDPEIGDTHQGGIVFWLDGNGGGLIAAPTDQSTGAAWGCDGTAIPGADGIGIGYGKQNTIDILNGCETPGTAAGICANLTLGGYDDWFLPSKDELIEMLGNIGDLLTFDEKYWSSTEFMNVQAGQQASSPIIAWGGKIGPISGMFTSPTAKSSHHHVRAVRAF